MAESVTEVVTPPKDFLSVDPDVPGQKFFCISFISPEKVLKTKTQFFMEKFWKWFKQQKIENIEEIDIWEQYKVFELKEESKLEEVFHEENQFQTTIRGLKVRGTYETEEEARIRCQVLQRIDKTHSVFVAPVGFWVPWDPATDGLVDQVYQERQLNDLMKHYNQNEEKRDVYYEQQKQERSRAAAAESQVQRDANVAEDMLADGVGGGGGAGGGDGGGAATCPASSTASRNPWTTRT